MSEIVDESLQKIALSIAVVPLLGLALNYTPFGSRLGADTRCALGVHGLACCDRVHAEAGAS